MANRDAPVRGLVAKYLAETSIGDAEVVLHNPVGVREEFRYGEAMEIAAKYIRELGGFERFAEWGFI